MTARCPSRVSPTITPRVNPAAAAARKPKITSRVVIHSPEAMWPPVAMFLPVSHSSAKVSAGPGRRMRETNSSSAISHHSPRKSPPSTMIETGWGTRSIHLPAYQRASASDIWVGAVLFLTA